MNGRLTAVLTASAAIALPGCGEKSPMETEPISTGAPEAPAIAPETATNPGEVPQTVSVETCVTNYFKHRQEIPVRAAREQFNNALKLADKVDDPEVQAVAKFIRAGMSYRRQSPNQVEVVMLNAKKDYDCPPFDGLARGSSFGYFDNNAEAFAIIDDPEQPLSDFWGALSFLHHARYAMGRVNGQSSPYEELKVRLFEQRIVSAVGGSPYRDLLKTLKERMRDKGFNPADGFKIHIGDDNLRDEEIDSIFGKSPSRRDDIARRSVIQVQAVFELIREVAPNPSAAAKAQDDFIRQAESRARGG